MRGLKHLKHLVVLGAALASGTASAGILFIGTDTEEFGNLGVNYLVKATVSGANYVSQVNIPLDFELNGLGDGPGYLYAGSPDTSILRTIDYNGNPLTAVPAGFSSDCCNEEMQFAGGNLYHAHWPDNIQRIDPTTGAVLQTYVQPQVVGMALVGATIWITHWDERTVGTWDPATNLFTPVFTTPDFAGALAYDPDSAILWVGQLGGNVVPYTLGGVALNAGFQPFAFLGVPISTIDGLTFQGEANQVPEPATLALVGFALAGLGFSRRRKLH